MAKNLVESMHGRHVQYVLTIPCLNALCRCSVVTQDRQCIQYRLLLRTNKRAQTYIYCKAEKELRRHDTVSW